MLVLALSPSSGGSGETARRREGALLWTILQKKCTSLHGRVGDNHYFFEDRLTAYIRDTMTARIITLAAGFAAAVLAQAQPAAVPASGGYPIDPVPFTSVKVIPTPSGGSA